MPRFYIIEAEPHANNDIDYSFSVVRDSVRAAELADSLRREGYMVMVWHLVGDGRVSPVIMGALNPGEYARIHTDGTVEVVAEGDGYPD